MHDLRSLDCATNRSDLNSHKQTHDSSGESAEVIRKASSTNLSDEKEKEANKKTKPRGSLGTALIERPNMKHRNSAVSAISDKN